MNKNQEKRISERFNLAGPIKFAHSDIKNVFEAKLINCSEDGIYFESDIGLQPGTDVFLADSDDNKFFRAEVIWCKKVDSDGVYDYGIGARYKDPVF